MVIKREMDSPCHMHQDHPRTFDLFCLHLLHFACSCPFLCRHRNLADSNLEETNNAAYKQNCASFPYVLRFIQPRDIALLNFEKRRECVKKSFFIAFEFHFLRFHECIIFVLTQISLLEWFQIVKFLVSITRIFQLQLVFSQNELSWIVFYKHQYQP